MEEKHSNPHLYDQSTTCKGERQAKAGAPDTESLHCIFVGQMEEWDSMHTYHYHFQRKNVEEEVGVFTN